jgi:hypothetical protein
MNPLLPTEKKYQSYELAIGTYWPPNNPHPYHTWGENYMYFLDDRWCIGTKRLLDEFEKRDKVDIGGSPVALKLDNDQERTKDFVEHCKTVCRFFHFGGFTVEFDADTNTPEAEAKVARFRHDSAVGPQSTWVEKSHSSCTTYEFNKVRLDDELGWRLRP